MNSDIEILSLRALNYFEEYREDEQLFFLTESPLRLNHEEVGGIKEISLEKLRLIKGLTRIFETENITRDKNRITVKMSSSISMNFRDVGLFNNALNKLRKVEFDTIVSLKNTNSSNLFINISSFEMVFDKSNQSTLYELMSFVRRDYGFRTKIDFKLKG